MNCNQESFAQYLQTELYVQKTFFIHRLALVVTLVGSSVLTILDFSWDEGEDSAAALLKELPCSRFPLWDNIHR